VDSIEVVAFKPNSQNPEQLRVNCHLHIQDYDRAELWSQNLFGSEFTCIAGFLNYPLFPKCVLGISKAFLTVEVSIFII